MSHFSIFFAALFFAGFMGCSSPSKNNSRAPSADNDFNFPACPAETFCTGKHLKPRYAKAVSQAIMSVFSKDGSHCAAAKIRVDANTRPYLECKMGEFLTDFNEMSAMYSVKIDQETRKFLSGEKCGPWHSSTAMFPKSGNPTMTEIVAYNLEAREAQVCH